MKTQVITWAAQGAIILNLFTGVVVMQKRIDTNSARN
jgi:hypothetical protein